MSDLKALHDRAAAANKKALSCTCGELAELAAAVAAKLPKDEGSDQTLDAHVAFTNAGKNNPPQTVCQIAVSSVLLLTTLLFGPVVNVAAKSAPKEPAKP